MGFEAVNVYVASQPPETPVQGVVVKVYSQDGALIFAQETTDEEGKAAFLLDSGLTGTTYQFRFFKHQFSIKNPFLAMVLPAPEVNDFTVVGESITPPAATDPRLCTASGFFIRPDGSPAVGVDIHFIARFDPLLLDGKALLVERVAVRTDKTGYAQVNLVRLAKYETVVQGVEELTRVVGVPDAARCSLPDLLFPVVSSVTFDPPGPFTLAVDEEVTTVPTVVASSGLVLEGTALADVCWRSLTPDIVALSVTPDSITIRGVAPGSGQIVVERSDLSIIRIPNTGIEGSPLLVTVV